MSGVTFIPHYTLRASSSCSDNSLKIRYQARISNLTGEDWNEVSLSISTAQASETTVIPQLQRWTVDFHDASIQYKRVAKNRSLFGAGGNAIPQQQMLYRTAAPRAAAASMFLADGSDADMGLFDEEVAEMTTAGAEVSEGITSTFIIQGKQTLKDGEKNHTVVIRDLVLDGRFTNICVPKVKDVEYLQVPLPLHPIQSLMISGTRKEHDRIPPTPRRSCTFPRRRLRRPNRIQLRLPWRLCQRLSRRGQGHHRKIPPPPSYNLQTRPRFR